MKTKRIIMVVCFLAVLFPLLGCEQKDPCKEAQKAVDDVNLRLGHAIAQDKQDHPFNPFDSAEVKALKDLVIAKAKERDAACNK